MGIFIEQPLAALAVAAVFALMASIARTRSATVVAGVWAGYAAYEYLMFRRVLCSGECNIRIDLLFIHPVLLVVSVWAAGTSLWQLATKQGRPY